MKDSRAGSPEPATDTIPENEILLRRATPEDAPALHRQWVEAGWMTLDQQGPKREVKRFPTWVAEVGGAVVAGAIVVPFEQLVGGAPFSMAGVRGVTCALHMRRRGIVDVLMQRMMHDARADFEISTLWPFSPPFYERYDYGTCGNLVTWRALLEDIDAPEPHAPPLLLARSDLPALLRLIERNLAHVGNGAVRFEAYWAERLYFPRDEQSHEPVTMGWFDEHGELSALVCFTSGGEKRSRIRVQECIGVDDRWRRVALGFFRTLRDQYTEIELRTPEQDLFYHSIKKPYRYDATVHRPGGGRFGMIYEPNWQARILNPAKTLSRARELHGEGGNLVVELTDSVFPDLNGTFLWTISRDEPGWRRVEGADDGRGLPRLSASMGDLSRIWYGAVDVYQLIRLGRVQCDQTGAEMVHAAFGGFRCDLPIGF